MGCDVHIIVEKRTDKYGWVGLWSDGLTPAYFGEVNQRHYRRFAALTGVRGDGPQAKGMPEDASSLSRMLADHWQGDAHSHTHYTLAETLAIYNDPATFYPADPTPKPFHPRDFVAFLYDDADLSDYRVVFFFDN